MPLIPFDSLPDHARVWVFPGSRGLTTAESARLLATADQFLSSWTAHQVPLNPGRDWRLDQFLLVAVDERAAGASGCSIDALVRSARVLERDFDLTLTDNRPVWFRNAEGGIETAGREAFQQLADAGVVTPETTVFDHTVQTVGALRGGRWEVAARESWHGEVFFRSVVRKP